MEKETMKLEDIHLLTQSVHTELCSHRAYMELHDLRLKSDGLYMQYLTRLNKLKDLLERLGRTQEVFLSPVAVDGTILRIEHKTVDGTPAYYLREYRVYFVEHVVSAEGTSYVFNATSVDGDDNHIIISSDEVGKTVFLTSQTAMDELNRLRKRGAKQCVIE